MDGDKHFPRCADNAGLEWVVSRRYHSIPECNVKEEAWSEEPGYQ